MRNVALNGTTGAGFYGRESAPIHRCGKCNNGSGVTNPECPNYPRDDAQLGTVDALAAIRHEHATDMRASQSVPYDDIDGVDRDTDSYLERADMYRDAEIDKQMGW